MENILITAKKDSQKPKKVKKSANHSLINIFIRLDS